MNAETLHVIILSAVLLILDVYVLSGLKGLANKWKFLGKKWFVPTYWGASFLSIGILNLVVFVKMGLMIRVALIALFFITFLFKICFTPFIFIDDVRRFFIWLKIKNKKPGSTVVKTNEPAPAKPNDIPRSEFLMKAGLLAGAIPLAAFRVKMKSGLYDYHVIRQKIYLPNLPKAFDGIRIGQISDIHSGSFYNKKAVLGGIEMMMREKADVIFFTGDLVNVLSEEVKDYLDIFSKVKAPLGVYSCLGNHDYGDYGVFPSIQAKQQNFNNIVNAHKTMGYDLLRNENRRLKVGNEEIGILGIENWGELSRFPKYGRMDLAVKNTDDLPVKLLLSHDPSHWRAQVLKDYPQIDMMFSGHTHGMQMGIRTENFQWSPIEYIYSEWAGLYQHAHQQLYVNVGYGFLGVAGRVGILPEITIFELKAGNNPLLQKA